jgi:glycosyltransferase involved in cell wall biosynthesis
MWTGREWLIVPKVSVITINLNNRHGLEKTIESVLAQTYSDYEFILIDGGSSDGSIDVINRNADRVTRWISEADSGIFHAQNKGADKACGDYLLFLNSGDILENNQVLEEFAPHLHSNDMVYGDMLRGSGEEQEHLHMPDKLDVCFFIEHSLGHPCTFISRALFRKLDGYRDMEFTISGDYEFYIRALFVHNASYRHIPGLVAVFDSGGISSGPLHRERQEAERRRSWRLNFSEPVVRLFEEYTELLRSRELRVGGMIKSVYLLLKGK